MHLFIPPVIFQKMFDSKVMRSESYISLLSFWTRLKRYELRLSATQTCSVNKAPEYLTVSLPWAERDRTEMWPKFLWVSTMKIWKYLVQTAVFLVFSTCTVSLRGPCISSALSCKLYWLREQVQSWTLYSVVFRSRESDVSVTSRSQKYTNCVLLHFIVLLQRVFWGLRVFV